MEPLYFASAVVKVVNYLCVSKVNIVKKWAPYLACQDGELYSVAPYTFLYNSILRTGVDVKRRCRLYPDIRVRL